MLIVLWILGMLAAFFMTLLIYRKAELGRVLIVSQGFYYCFYIVVSGIMIWMNHFNLFRGVLGAFLIELAVVGIICIKRRTEFIADISHESLKRYISREYWLTLSWKKYLPVAILLVIGAFLVRDKAGVYGTGQDQGLYQIRAMMYMGGYNDNIVDFPEFYTIENNWERNLYLQEIADMDGYYLLNKDGIEGAGEVNGIIHGISTFPALLGLWGSIFGLSHMTGILTVLYLLTVANVWLIGDNLKFKPWVSMIMAVFIAVCPVIVWSAKQTLTEMGFTLMVCAFFAMITENTKKKVYCWSVVPLLAACYYHVIFTVVIPLLVIVYFANYMQSKKRGFLAALMVLMIGYPTGFSMMKSTALHYTMKNFSQLFSKTRNLLNGNNVEAVIWIASLTVILIALILWQKKVRKFIFTRWSQIRISPVAEKIVLWGLRGIAILLTVFFVYKGIKAYRMNMWPMKMSILGYLFMTGYIMIPAMLGGIWLTSAKGLRNRNILMFIISTFYIMFLYCGVLWVLIYYYYYYARYLAPFVVLILIMAGYFLNRFKWYYVLPVCVVMAGLVLWQSRLLYTDRDLTYFDYEQMEDMVEAIEVVAKADAAGSVDGEDEFRDVILVFDQGYHIQRMFVLAMKGLTGADILYLNYDRLEEQLTECNAVYDHIYLLQYDLGNFNEESGEWTYLYRGMMESSLYDNYVAHGLPYAKVAVTMESPVSLLIYNR